MVARRIQPHKLLVSLGVGAICHSDDESRVLPEYRIRAGVLVGQIFAVERVDIVDAVVQPFGRTANQPLIERNIAQPNQAAHLQNRRHSGGGAHACSESAT